MRIFQIVAIGLLVSCKCIIGQEIHRNLSDEDKIYGLSKVWKEADRNFVYFDHIPNVNWDAKYQEFIPKVLKTKSTYEYYKELQRFCSLLNDGHTRVYLPWDLNNALEVSPPLQTDLISGKVFITKIFNDSLGKLGLVIGAEILEYNGQDIMTYANEKVMPYVFYSTPQDMIVQVFTNNLLKGSLIDTISLKVSLNSKQKLIKFQRNLKVSFPENKIFEFKILENNIGYLKINRFWGDDFKIQFDNLINEIQKTSKLIIDVSENGGGNSDFSNYVLSFFVDKPFETSRWKSPMYIPAYASWGRKIPWLDNDGATIKPVDESKQYKNQIAVLISEKTYSAAEDFISAFLNTNRGTIIGRATAGTTGNPIWFPLPDGGGCQFCSKRDYLSNGNEFVGYGISPQIVIDKTLDENALIKRALVELNKK
jgi:carboxyl-terminal processing protease